MTEPSPDQDSPGVVSAAAPALPVDPAEFEPHANEPFSVLTSLPVRPFNLLGASGCRTVGEVVAAVTGQPGSPDVDWDRVPGSRAQVVAALSAHRKACVRSPWSLETLIGWLQAVGEEFPDAVRVDREAPVLRENDDGAVHEVWTVRITVPRRPT